MIVRASAALAVGLNTVLASARASRNVSVARRAAPVRCWLMRVLGVLLGIVALSCSHMGFAAGRERASHAPLKWREPTVAGAGITAGQGRRRIAPSGAACRVRWAASRAKVMVTADREASA